MSRPEMSRDQGFAGRTAVVTGAGGGMGLQIARDLQAAGATVVGLDLKERPAELADALYERGDVSDEGFVGAAIGRAFAARGRLDFLVNAAGVLLFDRDRSLVDVDLAVWNRVIAINLTGCMLTARHALPLMRQSGGGAMVHFSSTQCLRGDDKPQDAYQVAKAGIVALSKSIAIQFATDRIRSNVILPGPTESPMQARWQAEPAMKHRTASVVPLGRVGSVQDMADACVFLLSERADFITGTELIVDGGLLARP
jgi:NAD(P)-dependent dehydrogenase (short-subunit alcohol dehydrogenase family)